MEQIAATVQVDFAKDVAMNVASAPECPYRHGSRHLFHRFVRSRRSSFSSLYNVCRSVDIDPMRGAWERIVGEERGPEEQIAATVQADFAKETSMNAARVWLRHGRRRLFHQLARFR